MSRRQKHPLRSLTATERAWLERIAHSGREPYNHVMRARALLAVADGSSYTAAAKAAGRQSGDSVGALVQRFNVDGLSALTIRPGRGRKPTYSAAQRRAIIAEVQRRPDPRRDGTSSWSLTTLRRAVRAAGLPHVSTYTIRAVLHEAGYRWVGSRTWCETGHVTRRRKTGMVRITDPDATAKKT